MPRAEKSQSDGNTGDFWLAVPQAVYLEATRDIETAIRLPDHDPRVLVVNVMRRLGRIDIPGEKDWGRGEAKEAVFRALDSRRGQYDAVLRKLEGKLLAGLAVKGRRELDAPLELIDPAEFTGLKLSGSDAVSRMTGEIVWHDLRISARAQAESLAKEAQFEPWDSTGDPVPRLLEWARTICEGDLDKLPGREELLRLFRKKYGPAPNVSQHMMREVRRLLASQRSKKGGKPTHRR